MQNMSVEASYAWMHGRLPAPLWNEGALTTKGVARPSRLFDELRLQLHGADAVDLAIDVVVSGDDTDVLLSTTTPSAENASMFDKASKPR